MEEAAVELGLQNKPFIPAEFRICSPSLQNEPIASWIKKNICKKECAFYDKDTSVSTGADVCKCGYAKARHVDEAIRPEDDTRESWDRHTHVRELPTDAFGDIEFSGLEQKMGKYARVSADTSPEVLYQLLTEQWKLSPPNLLISVTGGTKNFYLRAHLKNMFHRCLIKMAQTTGAWIITGGTNAGVMKHVGRAARALSSSSVQGPVVAIGIATWGIIHNSDTLVSEQGRFPASYSMDMTFQGRLSCLDNNHTHFLLVDDGTHGQYGKEIDLRSRLEKHISKECVGNTEPGTTIPVVCVLLEGGPGSLSTIYNAMINGTPCVVLEGSGRIADVIAQVADLPVQWITISLIHDLVKSFFGQEYNTFADLDFLKWTKMIQDIVRMPHLLTVYRVSEDSDGDVDVAVLQALLKASRSRESPGDDSWKRQLDLAIAWNRADVAEAEIFTKESQWQSRDLHEAMFSALVGNKPKFVSLLLENGVSLRDFLQEKPLRELYRELPRCSFGLNLAKRVHRSRHSRRSEKLRPQTKLQLSHVYAEVRHLLGDFTQPLYPCPPITYNSKVNLKFSASPSDAKAQQDPRRDLFLWAVVQNNRELADIFWELCTDCMAAALAATKILKKMADEGSDPDEAEEMRELAGHYEERAIGVFNECHKIDEQRTRKLLDRVLPSWGKTTCMRLALEADDKSFVAQSGVQTYLKQMWSGELSVENSVWRVMMCIVFFPLIYTGFLIFRRDEVIQEEEEKDEEIKKGQSVTRRTLQKNHHHETKQQKSLQPLNCWERFLFLFGSPQVKFYLDTLSYFTFLVLFAVVLMIDFQETLSPREMLLYIWLFSLLCEEIRQLFHDPDGFGIKKKARMYIEELWNWFDILSIILFIIGFVLRLIPEMFYAGKILLCVDFIVVCLRFMAIFSSNQILGPQIIIVKRMANDLFFFMFLLSIWVVAYGVAKQGILIQNESRLEWIFRGAIYEPYLTIFGNFPTNFDKATFDIKTCSLNGSDPLKPKCPLLDENQMPVFPEWLSIILLCVYLLFANILMLNLLIAIFNFTFQEVQNNTNRIWKFQRYKHFREFRDRPALPHPLSIFIYIFRAIKKLCKPCNESKNELSLDIEEKKKKKEEEELLVWEALMKDRYLVSLQTEQNQNTERHVPDRAQKVAVITDQLEREDKMVSDAVLKRLEAQGDQSRKDLQWIMDSLRSLSHAAKEPPLLNTQTSVSEKEDRYHVNARQLQYPDSKQERFPVPEEKVPWEVQFRLYRPINAEETGDHVDGSESEAMDNYRNPGGRTGIRGRGALSHLGPNLHVDLVLTRWRGGKKSDLVFVAVWDKTQGTWALPGGPVQSADQLPTTLQNTMATVLYQQIKAKVPDGTKVYEGYVDDCRNTDNAWVETTALNIHLDKQNQLMEEVNSTVENSHGCLQWLEVSSSKLGSYQTEILRKVAEQHISMF